MLQEFRIRDLGVIADATIPLHSGLTVLTGETGAGKTMVVSGLGLMLGGRGDAGLVRAGRDRLVVEGLLDLPVDHPALVRAEEAGGDVADGLVLVRTVTAEGRSRAHVGGRSAPVGLLGDLGEHLVVVHGQADQWRLRRPDQHRDLLDAFGGPAVLDARAAYEQAWDELRAVTEEADRLERESVERNRQAEALRHGLEQIETVDPQPDEDTRLAVESERLGYAAELQTAGEQAALLLGGDDTSGAAEPSVLDLLGQARHAVAAAADHDPALAALHARVVELAHLSADLVADLASYAAGVDTDPARLQEVEERRARLHELSRRYGPTLADVLAWNEASALRLLELDGGDDRLGELRARAHGLQATVEDLATRLTSTRTAAAASLGESVTAELAALAMERGQVTVAVTPRASAGRSGRDDVEILLQANPGSRPGSISKVGSGGELSRVMLAIELVTAGTQGMPPTFIFDEVDAGIGGQAALAVGARLAALAEHAQVVVVTHLAQVAAYADRHLVVSKAGDESVTESDVREVAASERESELARMMSGNDTVSARRHARELLATAERDRALAGPFIRT